MEIRTHIREGIRWSILEKIIIALLHLLQLMVIARYIDTVEIGLMAMLSTCISISSIFSEMGLANSIMHYQEEQARSLLALHLIYIVAGVIYAVGLYLSSPLLADFFRTPQLENLMIWASTVLVIDSLGQLPRTLLHKAMDFRKLSIIKLRATVAKFIITVGLAINDWGIYALLWGMTAGSLLDTVLVLKKSGQYMSFSVRPSFLTLKPHLNFGAYQTAERLSITISTQFDTLIIGRVLGAEALGVYDLLKRLLARPMQIINPMITNIATPVLARQKKDMKALYLKQILYLCSISFPIYIFCFSSGEALIRVALSGNYLSEVNLMLCALFSLYFMIYTVQNPIGTIIIASGSVKKSFLYNLVIVFTLPLFLYYMASYGLIEVVATMVLFQGSMIFVAQKYLLFPAAEIDRKNLILAILRPLILSILSFGAAYLIFNAVKNWWMEALLIGIFGGGLYGALSWRWNKKFIRDLIDLAYGKMA